MLDEDHRKLLGAFVRARRESITPDAPTRRRRTPGLRREELAARAGIGVTWVAWLRENSEAFRGAWDHQTVLARQGGLRLFQHPDEGQLRFIQHTLAEVERGDFRLVALQPADFP